MIIQHPAVCGTLESSDVMITVSPGDGEICIDLDSTVDMYYHDQIIKVMKELLALEGISSAKSEPPRIEFSSIQHEKPLPSRTDLTQ